MKLTPRSPNFSTICSISRIHLHTSTRRAYRAYFGVNTLRKLTFPSIPYSQASTFSFGNYLSTINGNSFPGNSVTLLPLIKFHASRAFSKSTNEKIVPFLLADIGEGITECELTQWFVKPGDKVSQFEKICEVQSDKAVVEISSRFDGVIQKLHFKVNDIAKVGKPLVDILIADAGASVRRPEDPVVQTSTLSSVEEALSKSITGSSTPSREILAAPAVRRIAREKKIDLNTVIGTGPNGRILKEDLETVATVPSQARGASSSLLPSPPPQTHGTNKEWLPISMIKKTMIKAMTQSLQIPHFVYTDEILMDSVMHAKKDLSSNERQVKLTYLPFLLKACSLALLQFPSLNAKYTDTHWQPRDDHHLGVAMDTSQGLLVPKVAHVQSHSIFSLAAHLIELQELAKHNKLVPAHFHDTTFTLSNIGAIGGDYMHPVIPFGQVCIVATGKIRPVPRCVFDNKKNEYRTEIQHVMPISISADHRYLDGATVAKFAVAWKRFLENPVLMLAHLK